MTNNKLIKVHNLPWHLDGDRPIEMYLWVSPEWGYKEKTAEFYRLLQKEGSINCGFADWLLTQGATDAVAEDWSKGE